MTPEDFGYFTCRRSGVEEGLRYAYRLADGGEYPDPASRWQPEGVHRPSAVFFPEDYSWSDSAWRGVPARTWSSTNCTSGTFTPEGTFEAIVPRLPELASLGVTALELMPVAQFPGDRNWGYDGVHPYAVQNSYGGPRALQRLIDAAHRRRPGGDPRRGLQPPRPGRQLPRPVRAVLHRSLSHPLGKRDQLRRPRERRGAAVLHRQCLRVGAGFPRRRPAAGRGPRHLRFLRAAHPGRHPGRGAGGGRPAESHRPRDRGEQPERRPAGQAARAKAAIGLDGVWSDDFHHSVHALLDRRARRLLHGFRTPDGPRQGAPRACSCTTAATAVSPPPPRQPRGGDWTARASSSACRITTRWETAPRETASAPCCRPRRSGWRAACCCCRRACRCCSWARSTARPRRFRFSARSAIRGSSRRCGAAGARNSPPWRFEWKAEIPDPQGPETFAAAKLRWAWPEGSPHAQLRQALSGSSGGPAPVAGLARPAAHHRSPGRRRDSPVFAARNWDCPLLTRPAPNPRPCSCSSAGARTDWWPWQTLAPTQRRCRHGSWPEDG